MTIFKVIVHNKSPRNRDVFHFCPSEQQTHEDIDMFGSESAIFLWVCLRSEVGQRSKIATESCTCAVAATKFARGLLFLIRKRGSRSYRRLLRVKSHHTSPSRMMTGRLRLPWWYTAKLTAVLDRHSLESVARKKARVRRACKRPQYLDLSRFSTARGAAAKGGKIEKCFLYLLQDYL